MKLSDHGSLLNPTTKLGGSIEVAGESYQNFENVITIAAALLGIRYYEDITSKHFLADTSHTENSL